jgi:toxin ParE1/3/4
MPSGLIVRVRWLKTANSDLDAATEYIFGEDPEAARDMYAHIRERVAGLAKRPHTGRPGRVFGTRELALERYPYVIPYRIRGNEAQVLRVFHTSRRPPEAW